MANNKIFYINYADLKCKVTAPSGWPKYFKKLYENSDILSYSEASNENKVDASLLINLVESDDVLIKFRSEKNFKKFIIKASNAPIFLFPSVHQFVSRIFNILFHLSGGFVLHSSSILVRDKAIFFVGESGRGKSTIVDLIHSTNSEYKILSDNSVFIKKKDNHYVMYPSPYLEANRLNFIQMSLSKKPPYKIGAVFFPYHAELNGIKKLSFKEKIELIQKNSHIPFQPAKLFKKRGIVNFGRLIFDYVDSVDMYKLEFVNNHTFINKVMKYVK